MRVYFLPSFAMIKRKSVYNETGYFDRKYTAQYRFNKMLVYAYIFTCAMP